VDKQKSELINSLFNRVDNINELLFSMRKSILISVVYMNKATEIAIDRTNVLLDNAMNAVVEIQRIETDYKDELSTDRSGLNKMFYSVSNRRRINELSRRVDRCIEVISGTDCNFISYKNPPEDKLDLIKLKICLVLLIAVDLFHRKNE